MGGQHQQHGMGSFEGMQGVGMGSWHGGMQGGGMGSTQGGGMGGMQGGGMGGPGGMQVC